MSCEFPPKKTAAQTKGWEERHCLDVWLLGNIQGWLRRWIRHPISVSIFFQIQL